MLVRVFPDAIELEHGCESDLIRGPANALDELLDDDEQRRNFDLHDAPHDLEIDAE